LPGAIRSAAFDVLLEVSVIARELSGEQPPDYRLERLYQPTELALGDEAHQRSVPGRLEDPRPVDREWPFNDVNVNATRSIETR
jgi:hypothetical protein